MERPILNLEFLKNVWKREALRKRILFTLGLIVVYKLLRIVPLPGIDLWALRDFFHQINRMVEAGLPGVKAIDTSIFGSAYSSFSILRFGVTPYLAACLFVQFVVLLIPPLKAKVFLPSDKILERASLIAAVVLCGLTAFFYSFQIEKTMIGDLTLVAHPGMMFRVMTALSVTAAFCLVLWLAHLINRKGIGNGVAVLFATDVFFKIIFAVKGALFRAHQETIQPVFYVVFIALLLGMGALALFLTFWKKEIQVDIRGQKVTIPLRLSIAGNIPVVLTMFLIGVPAFMSMFFESGNWAGAAELLTRGTIWHYIVRVVAVVVLAYVYMAMIINPERFAKRIRQWGGSVGGQTEEVGIEDVLYAQFEKLTFAIAGTLLAVSLLPDIVMFFAKIPYASAMLFGTGAFFVMSGVLIDVAVQLQAYVVRKDCGLEQICYCTRDALEAHLQQEYLKAQGIACEILPFRFTWGMPIKTAMDEYQLYVSAENAGRARELLETAES